MHKAEDEKPNKQRGSEHWTLLTAVCHIFPVSASHAATRLAATIITGMHWSVRRPKYSSVLPVKIISLHAQNNPILYHDINLNHYLYFCFRRAFNRSYTEMETRPDGWQTVEKQIISRSLYQFIMLYQHIILHYNRPIYYRILYLHIVKKYIIQI